MNHVNDKYLFSNTYTSECVFDPMKYILNNVECFHMICLAFQYVIVIHSILVFQ